MSDNRFCNTCNSPLPADAPSGICPKCLLLAGMPDETFSGKFTPPEPEELDKFFDDYDIQELIGMGGMGAVYRARQKRLDRSVAIKILPPEVGTSPSFAARFEREAQTMAKLNHANIVQIYDFGKTGDYYYFVMEFVDGVTLRKIIDTGGLSTQEAMRIVPEICSALQFAHNTGIVHRDIKPENILLDQNGGIKIADFGLAMLLERQPTNITLTQSNQVMGTLHYMAPEQMKGGRSIDHRADIFSLGVVFYELLTGELPIGRFESPSSKLQLDVRLDEVVLRALDADPERRYQQASEVQHAVNQLSASFGPTQAYAKHDTPPKKQLERQTFSEQRFSVSAIIGAVWAPFFFVMVALLFAVNTVSSPGDQAQSNGIDETSQVAKSSEDETKVIGQSAQDNSITVQGPQDPPSPSRSIGQWLLVLSVLPLGITAPFGTTGLGLLSISAIRKSQGRLVGLPLALADALFFPLLFLNALLVTIIVSLTYSLKWPDNIPFTIGFSLLICIVIDFLLVRMAWNKVSNE